jgi:hypothetical protein
LIVFIEESLVFGLPEMGFLFVLSQLFLKSTDRKFCSLILLLQHGLKI